MTKLSHKPLVGTSAIAVGCGVRIRWSWDATICLPSQENGASRSAAGRLAVCCHLVSQTPAFLFHSARASSWPNANPNLSVILWHPVIVWICFLDCWLSSHVHPQHETQFHCRCWRVLSSSSTMQPSCFQHGQCATLRRWMSHTHNGWFACHH